MLSFLKNAAAVSQPWLSHARDINICNINSISKPVYFRSANNMQA
ncbi:MAG: hypothetical protein JWQ27_1760 [Ferruginibacter sp.]|nr:hypothetical protein [Ferruginibacter sp.]